MSLYGLSFASVDKIRCVRMHMKEEIEEYLLFYCLAWL